MILDITLKNSISFDVLKLKQHSLLCYKLLKNEFTYKNPKFLENEKWGYSNFNTPHYLFSYEILNNKMFISRGAFEKVLKILRKFDISTNIIDKTLALQSVLYNQSKTILRADQLKFVTELFNYTNGCGVAYTSSGKTLMALELIKLIKQPALILVHTTFLMEQWINEASNKKLFNLSLFDIGGVGGFFTGSKRRFRKLNICLYHSLTKKSHLDFFKDRVGIVIQDECLDEFTPINTPRGNKLLKDINIHDFVLDQFGSPIMVVNKWKMRKTAFKFTLNDGSYLIASKDHKVLGDAVISENPIRHRLEVSPIIEQSNIAVFDSKLESNYCVKNIVKIECLGIRNLIDIEVASKDHLFIANNLIVSNCQKAPIEAVQNVINKMPARYKFGLTAEIKRKDSKEFLTFDSFGPVRAVIKETNSDSKIISNIILVPTKYNDLHYNDDHNYTAMITRMSLDYVRNILICKRAIRKVKQGELVIIFVERKAQAGILAKMLSKFKTELLIGPVNKKDVYEIKSKGVRDILNNYDPKIAYKRITKLAKYKKLDIIIGTQKAEVGLSIRTINRAIITTPINNFERLKQIKGRIERTYSTEQEKYFKCSKPTPILEVLVDPYLTPSSNAAEGIRQVYGNRVKTLKVIK